MPDDFERPKSAGEPMLPGGFRAAVTRELLALGFTPTNWHAAGVDCASAEGGARYVGLANLYRRAKAAGREEWPEMLRHFFGVLLKSSGEAGELPGDLHAVRDRLRVRVGPPFSKAAEVRPWQQLLPGTPLALNLVIDSDQYMTYVTDEMVEAAGLPADGWLRQGLLNLEAATPAGYLHVFHEESGLLGGHANDSYDAARALVLDAIAPTEAGAGAGWLVAVPARDWLFCLRVTAESLPSVPLLKIVAEKSHAEDAYPISDEVYWVRGGAWEVFPIVLSEEGAQVTPSEAFFEALNALGVGGQPPAEPGAVADGE